MKRIMKRFFVMLLAIMTMLTCVGGGTYAEESVSTVKKSIFAEDKTRESALTFKNKPKAAAEPVGEIEVEVGQTVKDTGFINTFKTDEVVAGNLEYGTTTFSTSLSGVVVDGQYYDIQNDPSGVGKMMDYVSQSSESAVSVNYDIKNKTGGKEISYAFTGKKSTGDNYVYVYYKCTLQGKAAGGQEITRIYYLGYKIKVKPLTAGIEYDANGGTIEGKSTFKDKRKELNSSFGFGNVDVDITSKLPTKDGYKFAFWYEPGSYKKNKKVYSKDSVDTNIYPIESGKNLKTYTVLVLGKNETVTLKAAWDKEYSLKYEYDVDGKTNVVSEEKGLLGLNLDDLSIKSKDIEVVAGVAKEKGEFKCWRDGTTDYDPGAKIKLTEKKSKVILKAIWNITTEYVDNKGNKLQEPVVEEQAGQQKAFAGYKFVKTEDTKKGVKYIYEKVQAPEPQNPEPQNPGKTSFISDLSRSFFTIIDKNKVEEKKDIEEKKDDNRPRVEQWAYICGYPDNTIRPNGTLTRAEAATMVTRLAKLDLSNKLKANYPDLKDGAWYLANINAALKAGMLDTDAKGNLRPDAPITRGEFIKMIAAIEKDGNGKAPFNDIAGHKYEKEINKVYSSGRITGYEDGSFKPDAFLTRAEAAVLLNRVFDRSADAQAIEGFEDKIYKFKDLDKGAWYYYELVEATNSHEPVSYTHLTLPTKRIV